MACSGHYYGGWDLSEVIGGPIEDYWESHFYIDFDNDGNYLFSGKRTDFVNIKNYTSVVHSSKKNYPEGLFELNFVDVQQELYEDKIIDSNKIYDPVFYGANVFMYESIKFWEPQSKQFRVVAIL